MARPRTKARKSYDELLEENAEKIRKHTEALQGLERERRERQAAKRDGSMEELSRSMQVTGLAAQEILDSLQKTKPESEQMAS